jgi:hypothetical protein
MKIYLLFQSENTGYDTYDSCVVCAENEEDAKTITPDGIPFDEEWSHGWCVSPEQVDCREIGTANDNQERGVICASFNAG